MTNETQKTADSVPGVVAAAATQLPALPMQQDPVMMAMVESGRLPSNWWASNNCVESLLRLADGLARSSMVPPDFRNKPDNVMVALSAGMPLGLSPLACVASVAVINGRPTLWGDAVMAQVLAHPSLVSIKEEATGDIEKGDRAWSITITREIRKGTEQTITRTFSVADAKKANLWKKAGPWSNYPDRMIYNRARAFALRDLFADVLAGVSLAADNDEVVHEVVATVTNAAEDTSVDQRGSLAPDAPEEEAPKKKLRKSRHTLGEPKTPRIGDTCGNHAKGESIRVFIECDGDPADWLTLGSLEPKDVAQLRDIVTAEGNEHLQAAFDAKPNQVADKQDQAKAAGALNKAMTDADKEDEDGPAPRKLVSSGGGAEIVEWCQDMNADLVDGGVAIDTVAMTLHYCDGRGWREVKPDEATMHNHVGDFIAQAIAKWLTRHCLNQRLDQAGAMQWAQELLGMKTAPKQFMALTVTQLGELWHEAR